NPRMPASTSDAAHRPWADPSTSTGRWPLVLSGTRARRTELWPGPRPSTGRLDHARTAWLHAWLRTPELTDSCVSERPVTDDRARGDDAITGATKQTATATAVMRDATPTQPRPVVNSAAAMTTPM